MARYKQGLLPDEMDEYPVGAQGDTGWITPDQAPIGQSYLPPGAPPVTYATNIPATSEKWKQEGIKHTLLPPTQKPPDDAITQTADFAAFWDHVVAKQFGGSDPLKSDPETARIDAEATARAEWESKIDKLSPAMRSRVDLKAVESAIKKAGSTAATDAKWKVSSGQHAKQQAWQVFKSNYDALRQRRQEAGIEKRHTEDITERRAGRESLERSREAQTASSKRTALSAVEKETQARLNNPASYDLNEQQAALVADTPPQSLIKVPKGARLRPRVLEDINRTRSAAGLRPLIEHTWLSDPKDRNSERLFDYDTAHTEYAIRQQLTAKGVIGKEQDKWIATYRQKGVVR